LKTEELQRVVVEDFQREGKNFLPLTTGWWDLDLGGSDVHSCLALERSGRLKRDPSSDAQGLLRDLESLLPSLSVLRAIEIAERQWWKHREPPTVPLAQFAPLCVDR
jgi:hypothetical protein